MNGYDKSSEISSVDEENHSKKIKQFSNELSEKTTDSKDDFCESHQGKYIDSGNSDGIKKKPREKDLYKRAQILKKMNLFDDIWIAKNGNGSLIHKDSPSMKIDMAARLLEKIEDVKDFQEHLNILFKCLLLHYSAILDKETSLNIVSYYRQLINISDRIIFKCNQGGITKINTKILELFIYTIRTKIMFRLLDNVKGKEWKSHMQYFLHNIEALRVLNKRVESSELKIIKFENYLPILEEMNEIQKEN